jgi:hypothetical protein
MSGKFAALQKVPQLIVVAHLDFAPAKSDIAAAPALRRPDGEA